jgi:hypothetical protein
MTAETDQKNCSEVTCLFCGSRTPVPAAKPARRSANRTTDANFRVSIIRCHICEKEAPYQISNPDAYENRARAAGAD